MLKEDNLSKISSNGFISIVLALESVEEISEFVLLYADIKKSKIEFEIVCCTNVRQVFEDVSINDFIMSNENIAFYYLLCKNLDDLMSSGLEKCLGDQVIELSYSPSWSLDFNRLIELSKCENYEAIQIVPSKPNLRDQVLSKLASKALNTQIMTLNLITRFTSRENLEIWNRRKMRHKVLRLAPQISLVTPVYIRSELSEISYPKRFFRIGMRSIVHASAVPLRWISTVSLIGTGIGFVVSVAVFITGITKASIEGWTTTNLQISIFTTLGFLTTTILSEYFYQIFENLNETPNSRLVSEKLSTSYSFKVKDNILVIESDK
jgi:hypothetical protein